jgi:hypothetical protein
MEKRQFSMLVVTGGGTMAVFISVNVNFSILNVV